MILLPGLLMVVLQMRALVIFLEPGFEFGDGVAIFTALCVTGIFLKTYAKWRDEKGGFDRSRLYPLAWFAVVPVVVMVFAGLNFAEGPSPLSAMKESAITGCHVDADDWRGVSGLVGVMRTNPGEVVFIHNVPPNHGDAVLRNLSINDARYAEYESLALDGREAKAEKILCFGRGDFENATLHWIDSGVEIASVEETNRLIALVNR